MNAGCAGKTVKSLENACHTLEVCSWRGAIQIHVYLTLPLLATVFTEPIITTLALVPLKPLTTATDINKLTPQNHRN